MAVNSLPSKASQQKKFLSLVSAKLPEDQKETTPKEYDSCETKRRLFYKTAFYFPLIKANELSLYFQGLGRTDILLIQYLIRTSSQTVIKTIDGTKQILKDISEAKWQWRGKIAKAISESLQSPLTGKAIERSEAKLIAKGLLIKKSFSNGDGTTTRYIAFSRHFMVIAKGIAAPQKVPELRDDMPKRGSPDTDTPPPTGEPPSPTRGTPLPQQGKYEEESLENKKNNNKDGPEAQVLLLNKTYDSSLVTHRCFRTRPFNEMHPFFKEQCQKYGASLIREVLDTFPDNQDWNEGLKDSLSAAFEKKADPEAYERKKEAEKAGIKRKQEQARKELDEGAVYGLWLHYIGRLERHEKTSLVRPYNSPCPENLKARLEKAESEYGKTDHNQNSRVARDFLGKLGIKSMEESLAKNAAKKAFLEKRKGRKL